MLSQDAWHKLLAYQSHDFVRTRYYQRHHRELSAQRAKEITSCFIQASEYFSNSTIAAEAVKPLLLYYGVLSLSRGLILFLSRTAKEENLKSSHGLEVLGWQHIFSKGLRYFSSASVRVTDGTFSELCEATNNITSKTLLLGEVLWPIRRQSPTTVWTEQGSIITFDDIVSRIPRLQEDYSRILGRYPNVRMILVTQVKEAIKDQDLHFKIFDSSAPLEQYSYPGILTTVEQVRSTFNLPDNVSIIETIEWPREPVIKSFEFVIGFDQYRHQDFPLIDDLPSGDSCVIWNFNNGGAMSPLLKVFVGSYFLGMLARYFPSRWMALLRSELGDESFPLLMALINHIEEDFPLLALRALEEDRYSRPVAARR